ncbi:hypothetical protein TNCV_4616111 [Trichonephila clavipes]|nr:hypothetical protein TNCV_4616111 [Trichonephila clavipes]
MQQRSLNSSLGGTAGSPLVDLGCQLLVYYPVRSTLNAIPFVPMYQSFPAGNRQVFGEDDMKATQIKEWLNRYKRGHTPVESDQWSRRPHTSRNTAIREIVEDLMMEVRCLTEREIVEQDEFCRNSAHVILCHYTQSGCEICYQAFVGGTKRAPS